MEVNASTADMHHAVAPYLLHHDSFSCLRWRNKIGEAWGDNTGFFYRIIQLRFRQEGANQSASSTQRYHSSLDIWFRLLTGLSRLRERCTS